jgi:hypothetical protein|tara:strand:- start:16875 stop:17384 length:510 start_codon:yes stop_codon:yes gene_type:complete
MSIFDKFKTQSIGARLIEEKLYEVVANELQNGVRRNGLWAKALAKSQGDESKAKALYISYRVQSLKDESEISEARKEHELEESRRIHQEQQYQEQKKKEREVNQKSEDAEQILKEKGYGVTKRNFGWLIIEPLGGTQKILTADDLYQFAISRESHSPKKRGAFGEPYDW